MKEKQKRGGATIGQASKMGQAESSMISQNPIGNSGTVVEQLTEALAVNMLRPGWAPDFGPRAPHPRAGASAVGARMPLIAYNINLATDHLDVARRIAATVRHSGGGLPHVKAIGVALQNRGIVQVSMNLTNYEATPIVQIFDAVCREARRYGVEPLEHELVGLAPRAALAGLPASFDRLGTIRESQILETRLEQGHDGEA